MPLIPGSSNAVISKNIKELSQSQTAAGKGRTHIQNVAIAMKTADESGRSHSKAVTVKSHPKHGPAQQHTFHGNEQRRGKK